MTEDKDKPDEAAAALEDEIDETLKASFPASDPPSWTLGTDRVVESAEEGDDEETPPRG